jgi:hypothetical protein
MDLSTPVSPHGLSPSGPDWVHEVKHDGYRLIVRRDGEVVRLFTRRGYDWTERDPAIADAAAQVKARSFTLDGEAVVCGVTSGVNFTQNQRMASSSRAFAMLAARLPLGARAPVADRLGGGERIADLLWRQLRGERSQRVRAIPLAADRLGGGECHDVRPVRGRASVCTSGCFWCRIRAKCLKNNPAEIKFHRLR